jgi:hypothetical protein
MSTPGYISLSKTKESGTLPQPIPANQWTLVDLGMVACPEGPNHINSQLYFESVVGTKLAVRTQRGSGNPTGQHNYVVKGPVWAVNYHNDDYVKPGTPPKSSDYTRGIEVWSDKPCVLQTRILKVTRPLAIDGATT